MSFVETTLDVSFIILTWNSAPHIARCITSIFRNFNANMLAIEIFIIDNGSCDNTKNIIKDLQQLHPDTIKPIFLKENTGTTSSRNLGLKQATGKYLVVLDSDVEVAEGSIEKLIKILESDKSFGLIVPKLLYPSGKLQKSTDNFPTISTKIIRYFFLKIQENILNNSGYNDKLIEVDYAISAFWVFRKKIIQEVGLLDENIFYAPEDVDYCLRIWKKGYKVIYAPMVSSVHNAQEISRGFQINKAMVEHLKGLFYYFKKHKYIFVRPKTQRSNNVIDS